MRFPVIFHRRKGGTGNVPTIGSDPDPRVAAPNVPPTATKDNVLSCKIRDINGWPVQRIVVGFTTAAASPTALNMDLYFWEDQSAAWYKVNDTALSVKPGQLFVFDTFAISEPSPLTSTLGSPGSPSQAGGMEVQLVVTDPGAQVNGDFQIVMGPDLTTVGT